MYIMAASNMMGNRVCSRLGTRWFSAVKKKSVRLYLKHFNNSLIMNVMS